MDTLASLALATEPPTESLLERQPHNRNDYILSREMTKHVLGQALYQFTIMMILVFTADKWVPESTDFTPMPVAGFETLDRYRSGILLC